jgi:sugar lactone lactonase YvrE
MLEVLFSLTVVFAGFYVSKYVSLSLPYPYNTMVIRDIPPTYLEIIENISHFSPLYPEVYSELHNIPLTKLNSSNLIRLFEGLVVGTESIVISPSGNTLLMMDKYGFIHYARLNNNEYDYELINRTIYAGPGRTLGFHFKDESTIVACNSLLGLVEIDITFVDNDKGYGNRTRILTNFVSDINVANKKNSTINYVNDLDIRSDKKKIYFTSSTTSGIVAFNTADQYYDTMRSFLLTYFAGDISGRVFEYDVVSGRTTLLVKDLYYANGIALSRDGSELFIVETNGLRVLKYTLHGDKEGQLEVFIDNLPGFPDGITLSHDKESLLISVVSPVTPLLKWYQYRIARWMFAWLLLGPTAGMFTSIIKKFGCVMRVSVESRMVQEILLDSTGEYAATISAVTEDRSGNLLLGNLGGNYVSIYRK